MKIRPHIVIALVAGRLRSAPTSPSTPATRRPPARPHSAVKKVRVAAVETASDPRQLRFSGITRAAQRAKLSFSLGARLKSREVEVGDVVKRGQILARLDDNEVKNGLATAAAALAEAQARRGQLERDVERVEKLAAAKAATPEELEKTTHRPRIGTRRRSGGGFAAARGRAAAERNRAPRALRRHRHRGAGRARRVRRPRQNHPHPLGRRRYRGAGRDPGVRCLPQLQPGAEVPVKVAMLGEQPVAGTIRSVGRSAAGPGQLFPVVVALDPAANVPPGATAELGFRVGEDAALSVPVGAVVDPGGRRPSALQNRRPGKGGAQGGGRGRQPARRPGHGASGNLVAGDRVVVGGQRGLLDGDRVEVEAVEVEP